MYAFARSTGKTDKLTKLFTRNLGQGRKAMTDNMEHAFFVPPPGCECEEKGFPSSLSRCLCSLEDSCTLAKQVKLDANLRKCIEWTTRLVPSKGACSICLSTFENRRVGLEIPRTCGSNFESQRSGG